MNPVILLILDGWGIAPAWTGNAIFQAKTPNFNFLSKNMPFGTLLASGSAVGLPPDEPGNSEAGHLNLGAGRIVHQDVGHISRLIQEGSFFKNKVLLEAIAHVKKNHSRLHLLGLVSDGGVHSHIDHLFALLKLCQKENLKDVAIHVFTDGRDSSPYKALSYISQLQRKINELGVGFIATISGRYYAMDRDKRYLRTEKAYRAIAEGIGQAARTAVAAVSQAYRNGLSDEFIIPTVIKPTPVADHDAIIFFNVRGDRARQLTFAFCLPNFRAFRVKKLKDLFFVTFTWYGDYIPNTSFAFAPEKIEEPLARVLSEHGLTQFHIAETEKYAHVTYFFNGQREEPFPKEERLMIPSPKVATYDLKPEMSAEQVTDELIKRIISKKYTFILVNYANPDMVGHTGNLKAAIRAIEVVDKMLGKIVKKADETKSYLLVTADHGNAEQLVNPKTGEPDTEHTTNPVPFIFVPPSGVRSDYSVRKGGVLADVAPTVLQLLKINQPKTMTGKTLLEK